MATLHEYNIDRFLNGECNCLFITGIYGSGKTILSNRLALKNNAKVFHLDDIEENLNKAKFTLLPDEFNTFAEKNNYAVNIHEYSTMFLISNFCNYLMTYRTNEKYIVEGYQLMNIMRTLIDYKKDRYILPVILLEANPIVALLRKYKRESKTFKASFFSKVKMFFTSFYSSLSYQLDCLDRYKQLVKFLNMTQERYEKYYKKE